MESEPAAQPRRTWTLETQARWAVPAPRNDRIHAAHAVSGRDHLTTEQHRGERHFSTHRFTASYTSTLGFSQGIVVGFCKLRKDTPITDSQS